MSKRWSGFDFRYSGAHVPPYYYVDPVKGEGGGFIGGEIITICKGLNMSCRLVPPPDGLIGVLATYENGTIKEASGVLRQLIRNETDVGAGPYGLYGAVFENTVVTPTVRIAYYCFLTGMKRAYVTQPVNFTVAFDFVSWCLVGISILMAAMVLFTHNRIVIKSYIKGEIIKDFFIFVQTFLQESTKNHFKTTSMRLMGAFFFMGSFTFMQSFTSHSKAMMVVLSPTRRIQTFDDMIKYNVNLIYPDETEYRKMGLMLTDEKEKYSYVMDNGFGVRLEEWASENSRRLLVEGKGAICTMDRLLLFHSSLWCKTTSEYYYMSPPVPDIRPFALTSALNPNLPEDLLKDYKMSILWLFATGHQFTPDELTYKSRFDCMPGVKNKQLDTAIALSLQDIIGIFQTWMVMIAISVAAFIFEMVVDYLSKRCNID